MNEHLYIVTDGQYTKVGITNDLERRFASYRTHLPTFQIYKTYSANSGEVRRVEAALKILFKDQRVGQGKEWFATDPELMERYASTLLAPPSSTAALPSLHGIEVSSEADVLKAEILEGIERGQDTDAKKRQLMEAFAAAYKIGKPRHGLPKDLVWLDGMCVDLKHCDQDSSPVLDALRRDRVSMPADDHLRTFYHLVRLSTGHYGAICTSYVSMPYPSRFEQEEEDIVPAATAMGWYATFHHDWSWHKPDETKLVLYQRKTPVHVLLREWDSSFRKFVIERSQLLRQLAHRGKAALRKAVDEVIRDSCFPLSVTSVDDLFASYLEKFHLSSPREEGNSQETYEAFEVLFAEWSKQRKIP